jgi:hypothetical protein
VNESVEHTLLLLDQEGFARLSDVHLTESSICVFVGIDDDP